MFIGKIRRKLGLYCFILQTLKVSVVALQSDQSFRLFMVSV